MSERIYATNLYQCRSERPRTISGFLLESKNVFLCVRVSRGRFDNGGFVRWQLGVAEGILAVALPEKTAILSGHGGEEAEGGVL